MRRCFFLLSRFPFPPYGGDKLKSFNLLKILNKNFDLHVIIVTDETADEATLAFLAANCASFKVFYKSKWRCSLNALATITKKDPLQVGYYYFNDVQQYCKDTIAKGDIVICNLIRTAKYVANMDVVKVLDIVDSIFLNYSRSKHNAKSFFWRYIYKIELERLQLTERQLIRRFSATVFVNKDEELFYHAKGNTAWIPNGVSSSIINQALDDQVLLPPKPYLVFLGKMDYQPNVDSVYWLAEHVMPYLPEIDLHIIGINPTKAIYQLASDNPNIHVRGYIENPYPIIKNALAMVAPMQTGGGIQNKILESMAVGALVITNSLGAKPIFGAINGTHLMVCETPNEFVNAIVNLLEFEDCYTHIGMNASKLIRDSFTWERYERSFMNVVNKLSKRK
jgi:glycosyltransferase involved in cell wall biosynthesis